MSSSGNRWLRSPRVLAPIVFAAALIVACTGGGDSSDATPTATPDDTEATPTATRTPPPSRTAIPTATPAATPVPSQSAALEVIVEFAVSAELHNLAIFEIFSGGFQHELLSHDVEVDLELYELLIEQWEHLASIEADTLAALETLDNATVAQAPEPGATRPIALRPDAPAESGAAPASGLLDSAASFFGWVGGSGERSRERILTVTGAMSDAERDQLVAEWQQFYPDASSGVTNGADLITKLRAGNLDVNASRIHGQLLEVSTSSSDAPQYSNLAQDEGLLLTQVAVSEGVEGLKRGAEFNVDATVAVLEAQFPGIESGTGYADKADEWLGYLGEVYDDPTRGVFDVLRNQLDTQILEPFGEQLDAAFEGVTGELSGLVSSAAEQLLGFDSPSAALGAAADLGFARLEEGTRAAIADGDVQQVGGDPRAGLDDLIPALTVAVPDPADPVVTLPQGTYDVQAFDEDGVPVNSGVVAVEAGWEKPVGPEASALPTPLLRLGEVEERVAAEQAASGADPNAGGTPVPTATPVPTVTKWVKVSTVVNPEGDPTEVNVEATQGRREGTIDDWEIAETSFSHRWKDVDNGYTYWDWTFTYRWDAPPDTLEPGEAWPLDASGSRAGEQEYSGFPGEAFEYRVDGGARLIAERDPDRTVSVSGSDVSVNGGIASDEQEYILIAPEGTSGTFSLSAFMWNRGGADVLWTYEAQEVPIETPEPPPVSDEPTIGFPQTYEEFLESVGLGRYEVQREECKRFASETIQQLCDNAPAIEEAIEQMTGREESARLRGLEEPQDCLDFAAGGERLGCQLTKTLLEKDVEGCRLNFEGELRTICLVGIAATTNNPSLVLDLGDEAIRNYVATTGDFSVLDRIDDPLRHDEAVMFGLVFPIGDVLAEGSASTRVPPATFCESRIRGNYATSSDPDNLTPEGEEASNRNFCERQVMIGRMLHTPDLAICEQYALQIDPTFERFGDETDDDVRTRHANDCAKVFDDVQLLQQEQSSGDGG